MLKTRFTTLVSCSIPIQQAGMGGLSPPRLAAAVANAGGLGMLSVYGASPHMITEQLSLARQLTDGPIGANFIMRAVEPHDAQACVAAAAAKAQVVEFFYSEPDPVLIDLVHRVGALACWQVGSRAEALAAASAGCDFIVAQGVEAGGHVRGTISLLALLAEVLEVVDLPVVAAGGIGSGRDLAAVLAAGADGARIGTRFVAAEEAGAHPVYVQALIAARAEDTVYTNTFYVGWPDAPHRALRSAVTAAQIFDGEIVGQRVRDGVSEPIKRFQIVTPRDTDTGAIEAMSLWAGESVGSVRRMQPAAEIMRELVDEAERLLRGEKSLHSASADTAVDDD
jgi:nitronate monooxygenase